MANLGTALRQEITRLSRKEVRSQVQPVRSATTQHRSQIAALKRAVLDLQRQVALLSRAAQRGSAKPAQSAPVRFVAKGLRSLRSRLGLSASDFGLLVGVSGQSIYNWEQQKTVPGKVQLLALGALRAVGKREAQQRLEQSQAASKKKAPSRTRKTQ